MKLAGHREGILAHLSFSIRVRYVFLSREGTECRRSRGSDRLGKKKERHSSMQISEDRLRPRDVIDLNSV